MYKMLFIAVIGLSLAAGEAHARKAWPSCGARLPSDVVTANRDFSYCITSAGAGGSCAGLGNKVFNNSPKILNTVGHNEHYEEARVGAAVGGGAGKRRLVFLVQTTTNKILEKYFTADHYTTFCSLK